VEELNAPELLAQGAVVAPELVDRIVDPLLTVEHLLHL
jgi:hypothetical protein